MTLADYIEKVIGKEIDTNFCPLKRRCSEEGCEWFDEENCTDHVWLKELGDVKDETAKNFSI